MDNKLLVILPLLAFVSYADAAITQFNNPSVTTDGGTATTNLGSIAEDSALAATSITISATSGSSSAITYTIASQTPAGRFSIDGSTGVISVLAALDFETDSTAELVLGAADGGAVFSATATISVTNVAPLLIPTYACTCVKDAAAAGFDILQMIGFESGGTTVNWAFSSGNTNTDFAFSTALVEVASTKTLTASTTSAYTLVILGDDGALTSTATLSVSVTSDCSSFTCGGSSALAVSMIVLLTGLLASLQ